MTNFVRLLGLHIVADRGFCRQITRAPQADLTRKTLLSSSDLHNRPTASEQTVIISH